MKDRNVQFPNRYKMTKVSGTDDIFDLIPAPGEVFEEGDFLNKSTLLTDALCTALGLATTATPTEAMEKLRQLVNTAQNGVDNGVKIQLVSYVGTGNAGVNNPSSLTFSFAPKFVIFLGSRVPGQYDNAWYPSLLYSTNTFRYIAIPALMDTNMNGKNRYVSFGVIGTGKYIGGYKSNDGKTLTWYDLQDSTNAFGQLNAQGTTYYYAAFG